MAKIHSDQSLVPSVLDRLLDDEPQNSREAPLTRSQVLRQLKQSVRRDLENLLNTRWRISSWPQEYEELDLSLMGYGIPDFTGSNMSLRSERERLRRTVEEAIQRFDPRFKSVQVSLPDESFPEERALRFRISGLLHAEPAPEPVVFDSTMQPSTATFEVKQHT